MIHFLFPEFLLLLIPICFAYAKWGHASGVTGDIRIALILLLVFALTGPRINLGGQGIDVIVVADRSRSMPTKSHDNIKELIRNLQSNRKTGDRIGIVTFGSSALIEEQLSDSTELAEYKKEILPDGSDLDSAINSALLLVNPNRPARILVLSDGEYNGRSALSAARRAREAGVPIDFRQFERVHIGDVAIESLALPETVSPREPFQFSVWVYADRDTHGTVQVLRNGKPLTSADRDFTTGINHLLFRDVLEAGGIYNYSAQLTVPGDPLLENNRGTGVVRVESGPRVLVLNTDGAEGNLVRELKAARIPVDVFIAANHPVTQDSLDPYRAVVIENVPAVDFGRLKMARLAQFVEDLGGGLMLTGGERSFGTGGYFKSPLDDVLPVSMEMREEHRKNSLALAIALDRSGSMTASVKGGKTKMDLANLGTAECVRLLSAGDSVAVIAVDSAPHIIQALTPVDDPERIAIKALSIKSRGGGIFVYEALVAAGNELMKAEQSTKHIILFSDAADSEQPGKYKSLLKQYEAAGITVSVIGLGTKSDSDAKLLEDVAKLGKGNIMFTADAQELPRLFTQDTMSVARSTFVKKDKKTQPNGISGILLPDARLMGNLGSGAFPNIDGYNLSYLKTNATAGVISQDEYQAPWSAFWYRGLGRVAAVTLEVDGQHSGQFGQWDFYDDFLITHVRWLLGSESPNDIFVNAQREGQDAIFTVELDPDRKNKSTDLTPKLRIIKPGDERTKPLEPDMLWVGPDTLQARVPLNQTGTYRTLLKTGPQKFTRGPVVSLPYSPEYVPRIGLPSGAEILASIAELTGGIPRTDILEILADPPRSASKRSLLPLLFTICIILLLLEIAGRRLSLWQRMAEILISENTESVPSFAISTENKNWLPEWKLRFKKQKPFQDDSQTITEESSGSSSIKAEEETSSATSVANVLQQAKNHAKKRLKD